MKRDELDSSVEFRRRKYEINKDTIRSQSRKDESQGKPRSRVRPIIKTYSSSLDRRNQRSSAKRARNVAQTLRMSSDDTESDGVINTSIYHKRNGSYGKYFVRSRSKEQVKDASRSKSNKRSTLSSKSRKKKESRSISNKRPQSVQKGGRGSSK